MHFLNMACLQSSLSITSLSQPIANFWHTQANRICIPTILAASRGWPFHFFVSMIFLTQALLVVSYYTQEYIRYILTLTTGIVSESFIYTIGKRQGLTRTNIKPCVFRIDVIRIILACVTDTVLWKSVVHFWVLYSVHRLNYLIDSRILCCILLTSIFFSELREGLCGKGFQLEWANAS